MATRSADAVATRKHDADSGPGFDSRLRLCAFTYFQLGIPGRRGDRRAHGGVAGVAGDARRRLRGGRGVGHHFEGAHPVTVGEAHGRGFTKDSLAHWHAGGAHKAHTRRNPRGRSTRSTITFTDTTTEHWHCTEHSVDAWRASASSTATTRVRAIARTENAARDTARPSSTEVRERVPSRASEPRAERRAEPAAARAQRAQRRAAAGGGGGGRVRYGSHGGGGAARRSGVGVVDRRGGRQPAEPRSPSPKPRGTEELMVQPPSAFSAYSLLSLSLDDPGPWPRPALALPCPCSGTPAADCRPKKRESWTSRQADGPRVWVWQSGGAWDGTA